MDFLGPIRKACPHYSQRPARTLMSTEKSNRIYEGDNMYYHFTRGGNREVKYLAQGHTAKHQEMNPFLTRSKTQEHSEEVEAKQERLT